jgi:hypothetical protein
VYPTDLVFLSYHSVCLILVKISSSLCKIYYDDGLLACDALQPSLARKYQRFEETLASVFRFFYLKMKAAPPHVSQHHNANIGYGCSYVLHKYYHRLMDMNMAVGVR